MDNAFIVTLIRGRTD